MERGVYKSRAALGMPAAIIVRAAQETRMAITLTPVALERVRRFVEQTPSALGLRFGVTRTGCSGWGHVADLARDEREGDTVFEFAGVKIYVDATSLSLVDGTEIDFAKQGLSETFIFRNPNAAAECGCGESFTTAADAA
jgi:Iron-sulfur cluster assembly accessory protein